MSRKFPKIFRLITVGADLLTVIISYFVAVDLRNYFLRDGFPIAGYFDFSGLFLLIMIVWWLLLILLDAAEPNRLTSLKREIRIGAITTSIGLVVLLAIGFLAKYYFPRSIVISFSLTFIVLYIIQKLIGYQLTLKIFQARNIPILVVGTGDRAMEFYERITKTEKDIFKFKIVGFLDINEEKIGQKVIGNHHIIGSFRQLPEILKTYMIEEVFFIFRPRDLGYL